MLAEKEVTHEKITDKLKKKRTNYRYTNRVKRHRMDNEAFRAHKNTKQ